MSNTQEVARPEIMLRDIVKKYPKLTKVVNDIMSKRDKEFGYWPKHCFIPMSIWIAYIMDNKSPDILYTTDTRNAVFHDMQMLSALGAWRYSKGIYEFDDEIYRAVVDSEIKGKLPSDILLRLPEWCIYVKTPDTKAFDREVVGFFAWIEYDTQKKRNELRLLLDGKDNSLTVIVLHLGDWDIVEAVKRYAKEGESNAKEAGIEFDGVSNKHDYKRIAEQAMPFVSLILYICSDEPDISNIEEPEYKPSMPAPKKVKKGWCLFPAEKIRDYKVGENLGNTIRKQISEHQVNTGRTVRPHFRRGHSHTYWVGPRNSDERHAILKWVMPTIVGG